MRTILWQVRMRLYICRFKFFTNLSIFILVVVYMWQLLLLSNNSQHIERVKFSIHNDKNQTSEDNCVCQLCTNYIAKLSRVKSV